MIWVNLVAGIAGAVAAARAWRMLARRRRLRGNADPSCLAAWHQRSTSGGRVPLRQSSVIVVHALCVLIVSVLLLGSLNRAAPGPLSTRFETPSERRLAAVVGYADPQLNLIGWVAAALAAFVAGSTLGGLVGFGLVTILGPRLSVCISEDGARFGILLLPWRDVCSVRLRAEEGQILLYSHARPDSDPASLCPPTKMLYEKVEGMLGLLLARNASASAIRRRHGGQVSAMAVFGVVLVAATAAAFALYPIQAEWIWFFYSLELVIVLWAGRLFLNMWLPRIFVEG